MLFIISLLFVFTLAIQEHDLGKQDFLIQNIGEPSDALFFKQNVVVRTENNLFSAISLSNSSKIEWRAIVKDNILSHLLLKTGSVCIAQNSFMAFDNRGSLLWQHMVESSSNEDAILDIVEMTQSQRIAFLSNNTLYIFNGKDGSLLLEKQFEGMNLVKLLYDVKNGLIVLNELEQILGQETSTSVTRFFLVNEKLHDFSKNNQASFPARLRSAVVVNGNLVLAFQEKIIVHNLQQLVKEFNLLSYHDNPSFFRESRANLLAFGDSHFIYRAESNNNKQSLSLIFDLNNFGNVKVLKDVLFSIDVSSTQTTFLYTNQFASLKNQQSQTSTHKLTLLNYGLKSESRNSEENSYEIEYSSVEEFQRSSSKMIWHYFDEEKSSTYIAIRSIDSAFTLYSLNKESSKLNKVWQRQEALASLYSSIFVDLPVDKVKYHDLKEEFEKNFFSRTASQLSHVASYFSSLSSKLSLQRSSSSKPLVFTRDHFGYRKLIISITKNGNVFALHTTKGTLIWSNFFEEISLQSVYSMRTVNDTTHVVIIGKQTKENGEIISWVLELDSLTGNVINKVQMAEIIHANQIDLAIEKSHHTDDRIILLVDNEYNVYSYPDTDELVNYLKSNEKQIYFYLSSLSTGVITGFGLSVTQTNQVKAVSRWSKLLLNQNSQNIQNQVCTADGTCNNAENTEPINSVSSSSSSSSLSEKLHYVVQNRVNLVTPARVKGSGGVLWNYLNPNLIVATTINENEATITLYFIDSITGRLLYSQTQTDALGPLNIVVENNWVVFHYWSTKSHCYFMSVIDIYEAEPQWKRKTFSSFDDIPYKKNAVQNNFQIFKQSYFFPSSVSSMAVTVSNIGMSNSHILVGLARNGILALDKRIVDARRVQRQANQPTEEDSKEGIMPYRPIIDVQPLHLITFNYSVQNIRNIYTTPSHLESTSLVIAHGLDVYFVATSGASGHTFDRLDPNFDTPFLIIVCSIIFVASGLSHFYVKNYNLRQSWK